MRRIGISLLILALILPAAKISASPLETLDGSALKEKVRVPIIMYHALDKTPDNMWEITKDEFESDLQYLEKHGYTTVVMQDLIDFVHYGKPMGEKPIVLSFDDGRSPTMEVILPMLEQYNARITMAIIGTETDRYTEIDKTAKGQKHPHMTWDDVNNAAKSGRVEIQSHTYDLHRKDGAKRRRGENAESYRERLLADLRRFAEVLHKNTGLTPNSLAYPLGLISESSDGIIKEAGYMASLSCEEGVNVIVVGDFDCLYSLNRFLRPPNKTGEKFFGKIIG